MIDILLGGNDIISEDVPGNQHVANDTSIANERETITKLDKHAQGNETAATLVLMSPIPGCPSQMRGPWGDVFNLAWTNPEAAKRVKAGLELGDQTKRKYDEEVKIGKTTGITKVYTVNLWNGFVAHCRQTALNSVLPK